MDKTMILAKAGAGKTYHICNSLDINKRNIIITYTNQNVFNIYKELIKQHGEIPCKTMVLTFHSFLYRMMIRPFESSIAYIYNKDNFVSKGVSILEPPKKSIRNGIYWRKNPLYKDIKTLEHFEINDKYYSSLMSELLIHAKKGKISLIQEACENLNKFFDYMYIDEVQDFRENNWKVILEIVSRINNVIMVGDYFQHSVNGQNNHGIPFDDKSYLGYISYLQSLNINVDTKTLNKSRRCSNKVCKFINQKLGIDIDFNNDYKGEVIFIYDENKIRDILDDDGIVKLVFQEPDKYKFKATTWGYSKGDTYDSACVILTDTLKELDNEKFIKPTGETLNKLYVALTRSRGNVYIIKRNDFKKVEEIYLR